MQEFNEASQRAAKAVDRILADLLPPTNTPEGRLIDAMRYSVLGGGKKFRAFLCCEVARLFKVHEKHAARVAAAIESIHSYSLIHDDLPCMDDDDLRRGKPSLHKVHGEALAILTGDALQALAFDILAHKDTHPRKAVRLDLIAGLAQACGAGGMVGGQVFDMVSHETEIDAGALTHLQQLKTGALIRFSVEAGAILADANAADKTALAGYANNLGLAYQMADDLLDVQGTEATLGKTGGKDAAAGKVTFVSLLGAERARLQAEALIEQAGVHLSPFGARADGLRQAAAFVLSRKN